MNGQVSRDCQSATGGAVLGCIPPWRSACASMVFELAGGVAVMRAGQRFGLADGGTNLRPSSCSMKPSVIGFANDAARGSRPDECVRHRTSIGSS